MMAIAGFAGSRRNVSSTMILTAVCCAGFWGCSDSQPVTIPVGQLPDGIIDVLEIDDAGHETLTRGKFLQYADRRDDTFVLVDFWAEWCGPCRQLSVELKSLKKEWKNQLTVLKVDVDDSSNLELAKQLQISMLPMMLICRSGKIILRLEGAYPAAELSETLRSMK